MKVRDIMSSKITTISPDTLLQVAAQLMNIRDIGMLPVTEGDKVLGVITDRDIALRAVARGWSPMRTEARQIMSEHTVWCFEDRSAEEAARVMVEKQVRRLLVFNREMVLTGVVSLDDIALALRDASAVGQTFRDVVSPTVAHRAAA